MATKTTYHMMTSEFGYPLYIAAQSNGQLPDVTDNKADAAIWDDRDGQAKLDYHRAVTGYTGLQYVPAN